MEEPVIPYQSQRQVGRGVALVFAPHPDDEVFGCCGAIMRHVAAGDPVHVIVVTDGGYDPDARLPEDYVRVREQESVRAGEVLGYGRPAFWRLKDRELIYGEPLIRRIEAAIQDVAADLVYTPSLHEIHPDHRALAMAATEAVRRLGGDIRLAMYEVGVPLLYPNLLLDITDLVDRKQAAIACFGSQLQRQRFDRQINALNQYRSYTLPPEILAAEAYFVASASELAHDPLLLHKSEYQRQATLRLAIDAGDAPLVSVLIRSMGRTELRQALDSVALQTYPNVEVVVVNAHGHGHPEPGAWCGPFPLRFLDSDKPLGRSEAGNRALTAANGAYMVFLDDDDWFMPDHVSALAETLARNPDKKVAYGCVTCVDELKNPIDKTFCRPFDRTRLLFGNFIPIHATLFSRAIVDGGCRMDVSLDLYEDWDFWLQASAFGDFAFADHFSAAYRIGGPFGQGSRTDPRVSQEAMKALLAKWSAAWRPDDLWNIMLRVVELEGKTQALLASQQHNADLQQQLSTLQLQSSGSQQQLPELQQQNSDLRQQHSDLRQQLSDLRQQHSDLRQQHSDLRQQDSDLRQQHSDLRQQHSDLQQQLLDMRQQSSDLRQQNSDLQQQGSDLRQQNSGLQQQISALEDQYSQLQQQLANIVNSRTWRLTAPLRNARQWLRGVR